MAASSSKYDIIIIRAGIAGSVLASRLHSSLPHLSILLIEAGPDASSNPLMTDIKNAFAVVNLDYHSPLYTQSTSSSGRVYPLRERVQAAWEAAGVKYIKDADGGSPQGIAELLENLNDRKRMVILLLSGIGPAEDLKSHGIKQVVESSYMGENLHGHMCVSQWWQLRNPEQGLSVGSPNFNTQLLEKGFSGDWVITRTVPHGGLKKALTADEGQVDDQHPLLYPPRSHTESFLVYVAGNPSDPVVILDGMHITTTVMGMLPASRGTVKLASTDPATPPLIDNNYYATEADRFVMRSGLRKVLQVMIETEERRAMVKREAVAVGMKALSLASSNEEVDELIRARRSVLPLPIASHIQACVYALAEQAADIIIQGRKGQK
ncbi:hypothetical protein G7Y89_g4993 [Cudoniella acicularis]|uniref:Glucose-methanol-choline oxidoreductase C-terminal domain-containing protein n=1 Tax=Cudoniella acicularis TaxID=354080 RepID=A0A8H4RPU9_9HELO|nr:hypothetical protein G7Y89_g4993 [Cudoniella acicularis]